MLRVVTGHNFSTSIMLYVPKRRCQKEPRICTLLQERFQSIIPPGIYVFMVPVEQCLSVSFSCSRTAITVFNSSLLQAVISVPHAKSMDLTGCEEQYLSWTCDGKKLPQMSFKTDFKYLWPKNANGLSWRTGSRAQTISSISWSGSLAKGSFQRLSLPASHMECTGD